MAEAVINGSNGGEQMSERDGNGGEERAPVRVATRDEFDEAVGELFRTGQPIEAPSLEALAAWDVDLEDEGGGIEVPRTVPLLALTEGIDQRSGLAGKVSLDSFIVSATSYDDLGLRYRDGKWTQDDFAWRHILFPHRRQIHRDVTCGEVG